MLGVMQVWRLMGIVTEKDRKISGKLEIEMTGKIAHEM
jgi:hypothetical protein